jgi:hypothetical protein
MVVRIGLRTDGLSNPATSPVLNLDLPHGQCGGLLTGNGHDQEIGPRSMVGGAADHHCGAAFAGGLIREGKGNEDKIPELIAGHSRRRQGCPRHV